MAVKKTKTSKNPGASAKKTTVRKKGPAAKKPPIKQKAARPAKSSAKKTVSVKTTAGKKITPTRKKVKKMPEKKRDRLLDVKKALLTRREAIVKEAKAEIAKYMSGENRQLVDTALDEGDWAVVDISEDISLMRLGAHRKALHDIDEVLRKIGEGSYGICEECGEEISEKRLKVIPTAALCINCQGTKEQLEAVERQEEV
jgi:RNA polymerase-binding transcription factor